MGNRIDMVKSLPRKLQKEPLIESVFEVRFEGSTPLLANILLGHIMAKLGNMPVQKLPVADIPEPLRGHNPGFKYLPLFQLEWGKFFILVGDRMCAVTSRPPYQGWQIFKNEILKITEYLKTCGLLARIERYSLKYVDLIEAESTENQLSMIDFDLKLGSQQVKKDAINIRVELPKESFLHAVQIISNGIVEENGKKTKKGILISIDSIASNLPTDFWTSLPSNLEAIHTANKEMFFEFLKDETIRSLEPIYDDK
jgi:uncharacterized protein (TIGR04255 family)